MPVQGGPQQHKIKTYTKLNKATKLQNKKIQSSIITTTVYIGKFNAKEIGQSKHSFTA